MPRTVFTNGTIVTPEFLNSIAYLEDAGLWVYNPSNHSDNIAPPVRATIRIAKTPLNTAGDALITVEHDSFYATNGEEAMIYYNIDESLLPRNLNTYFTLFVRFNPTMPGSDTLWLLGRGRWARSLSGNSGNVAFSTQPTNPDEIQTTGSIYYPSATLQYILTSN